MTLYSLTHLAKWNTYTQVRESAFAASGASEFRDYIARSRQLAHFRV